MDKPNIVRQPNIPNMELQQYERYLPSAFDNSLSILEKVNKIIHQLNTIGNSTNSVIEQWNMLMNWITSNGLERMVSEIINEKIQDGSFDTLFDSIIGNVGDLETTAKDLIVNAINEVYQMAKQSKTEIGDMSQIQTDNKATIVDAINELKNATIINRQAPTTIGEATGYGTISGFLVRQQSVPSMALEVGQTGIDNIVHMPSGIRYVIPSATIAVEDSHSTLNRIDLIYVNKNGLISIRKGVETVNPVPPSYHGEEVPLAHVSVLAGDTSVNNSDIADKRPLKNLNTLKTERKENLVLAINELVVKMIDLTQFVHDSVASAVQEIADDIGDISMLETTETETIVGAINSLFRRADTDFETIFDYIDNLSTIVSENKDELVQNINELKNNQGVLTLLKTNNKDTIIDALNEVYDKTETNRLLSEKNALRHKQIYFNVKDYGAIGNNINDDTQAIIDAVTDANKSGRGVVFFPTGTYKITQTIVKKGYVSLLGANMLTTQLMWHGNEGGIMIDTANETLNGCYIEKLTFQTDGEIGNVTGIRGGSAIDVYHSSIGTFKDLYFHQLNVGIRGNAFPTGVGIFDCNFENIWFTGCNIGLWVHGSGNTITHPRFAFCDVGIALDYLNGESFANIQVFGGIFVSNNYDISIPNQLGTRPNSFFGTWFEQAKYGMLNIPNMNTPIMTMSFNNCMMNSISSDNIASFYGALGAITLNTCTIYQSPNCSNVIVPPASLNSNLKYINCYKINDIQPNEIVDGTGTIKTYTKVSKGEPQAIVANANTKVAFDVSIFDKGNNFNSSENYIFARRTGYYNVSTALTFNGATETTRFTAILYHNGVPVDKIGDINLPLGFTDGAITGSTMIHLTAGDTLQIYVTSTKPINILPSNISTYMKVVEM